MAVGSITVPMCRLTTAVMGIFYIGQADRDDSNRLTADRATLRILAKPSAYLESYFENTKGIVEGVDDVYYSNKIVVREIKDAAKRESGDSTTSADGSIAFSGVAKSGGNVSEYGLDTAVTTTNWIDERTPSFKIGYDETNQRLTFDGVNKDLGKGTGMALILSLYSPKLTKTNGLAFRHLEKTQKST